MADRLCSEEELAAMCVSGRVRIERALAGGDAEAAIETSNRLLTAMRAFCAGYLDWLVLTDDYVLEELGHEAHVKATQPERVAELAVRTGMTLENLVDAQTLATDGESETEARVREAIAEGDSAAALAAWLAAEHLLRAVHDLRRDAISDALGHIYSEHGVERLEAAQRYAAERGWWSHAMPDDFALDPRERLEEVSFMLTVGAFSDMWITEEEERWVMHMRVCGNCGRQVEDRYKTGDWGLQTVCEQGPITFGQPELTVYQTHLALIHHMYAIELVGAPWPSFRCVGLDQDRGPCELMVYKDPVRTDPAFYQMVGMTPPSG